MDLLPTLFTTYINFKILLFEKGFILIILEFLITLTTYVPTLITLCANRWVLGEHLCFIGAFLKYFLAINEIGIVTTLSVYR